MNNSYDCITTVFSNLDNITSELQQNKLLYTNVKVKGAVGDGITDDSQFFKGENLSLDSGHVFAVDKDTILSLKSKNILGGGSIKWNGWKNLWLNENRIDGIIPVSKLNDEIYCSMNLPSEAMYSMISYTPQTNPRINGSILYDMPEDGYIHGIGAIYKNGDYDLPDKFTICIGKMKLFVYSAENESWNVIESYPVLSGALYDTYWLNNTSVSWNNYLTQYDDHIELSLTKDVFKDKCVHFWTNDIYIKADNLKGIIVGYDAWIKEEEHSNKFVMTIGNDFSTPQKGITQGFSGRAILLQNHSRTIWGHNIPNKKYDSLVNYNTIINLYTTFQAPVSISDKFTSSQSSKFKIICYKENNKVILNYGNNKSYNNLLINPTFSVNIPASNSSEGHLLIGYLDTTTNSGNSLKKSLKFELTATNHEIFSHIEIFVDFRSTNQLVERCTFYTTNRININSHYIKAIFNNGKLLFYFFPNQRYLSVSLLITELTQYALDQFLVLNPDIIGFNTKYIPNDSLFSNETLTGTIYTYDL